MAFLLLGVCVKPVRFGVGLEFVIAMFTLTASIFLCDSLTCFCLWLWVSLCAMFEDTVSSCSHSCIPVIFPAHSAWWWWLGKGDILMFWLNLNIREAQMWCCVSLANIHTYSPGRELISLLLVLPQGSGFLPVFSGYSSDVFPKHTEAFFFLREMPLRRISQWLLFFPAASSTGQNYLGFFLTFFLSFLE